MARTISQYLHSKKHGTFGFEKWFLGHRLIQTENPEGIDIPRTWMDGYLVDPEFHKLPARVWNATISLYIHMMERPDLADLLSKQTKVDDGLEVAVFYTINLHTWEIEAWVPTQAIAKASVEIDYTQPIINLITGQILPNGMDDFPDHVIRLGTSHSHNTMWAGFSGTDDQYELGQPGIHIVAGNFRLKKEDGDESALWYHDIAPSIVSGGKRYKKLLIPDATKAEGLQCRDMTYNDLIEYDSSVDRDFDHAVLNHITLDKSSFMVRHAPLRQNSFMLGGWGGATDHRSNNFGMQLICSEGSCEGVISYNGSCMDCYEYYEDEDARGHTYRGEDASGMPCYGADGKLIGHSTIWNGRRSYIFAFNEEHKRLKGRFKWRETGEPWEGTEKDARPQIERTQKNKISDQDKALAVLNAMECIDGVPKGVKNQIHGRLKTMMNFMLFAREHMDFGVLDAAASLWREVTGGEAFTSTQWDEYQDDLVATLEDMQQEAEEEVDND